MKIHEYIDSNGKNRFRNWFKSLNAQAAKRVRVATIRIEQGNLSCVKGVGAGVFEYRIDFGPGYRVYFGKDGEEIVILLGGRTKKRQCKDFSEAQKLWQEYKTRKQKEF